MNGACLCLDVGDVRIGVAVSRSGIIEEPLVTLERKGRKETLNEIERLAAEHRVATCVIGLPVLEGGKEGEQAEKTRAFGRSLARRLPGLHLAFWDERYSSAEAREHAAERVWDDKALIDRLAAAFILQNYLDHLGEQKNPFKKQEPREQNDQL